MSAVGLGWERSVTEDFWVDIDNQKSVEPEWNAFELPW